MAPLHRPDLSVVLPTRDRAATLGAAITSVLVQPDVDLELIVVDDASTDGTTEILDELAHPRLRVLRHDRPQGATAARNHGIDLAAAPWVGFQDSDDVWTPRHAAVLMERARRAPDDVGVVYGRVHVGSEGGAQVPAAGDVVREGDLRPVLPRYNIVSLPSSIVRAEALRSVGCFDESLRRYQDWDLFLALSRRWRFAYVDEMVLVAGVDGERITTHVGASESLELLLERHDDLFGAVPDARAAYGLRLLGLAARDRDPRRAARHLGRVLRHPPSLVRVVARRASGRGWPIARPPDQ